MQVQCPCPEQALTETSMFTCKEVLGNAISHCSDSTIRLASPCLIRQSKAKLEVYWSPTILSTILPFQSPALFRMHSDLRPSLWQFQSFASGRGLPQSRRSKAKMQARTSGRVPGQLKSRRPALVFHQAVYRDFVIVVLLDQGG